METILVVDDDTGFRDLLATTLRDEGYGVDEAGSVAEARQALRGKQYDVVLTDLRLPDGQGIEVLRLVHDLSPGTATIMITAFGTVETAVEAMKLGASDYLRKPLSSPDELLVLVRRAVSHRRIAQDRSILREEAEARFVGSTFVTRDPQTLRVLAMARRVAESDTTVLIAGESGTGKEVLARSIHRDSRRAENPFVAVNCAALSPTLVESELFGHEKGAFTGATARHDGRFERARGGTLFLDEIGELDLNLQTKLLRVLQEKVFERVGGRQLIPSDARVITATNCDLDERVARKAFREDLYYRISAFPVVIPPLRERPLDIAPLVHHFLNRLSADRRVTVSDEAMVALEAYSWPGNARELQNVIERALILCEGVILPEHLPFQSGPQRKARTIEDHERRVVEQALQENGGNRAKTASQLGISVRSLQYKLKQFGIL